jgi:hypothetical protein
MQFTLMNCSRADFAHSESETCWACERVGCTDENRGNYTRLAASI